MFVKICANTNLDDTLLAAESGADAVGFVFAPSKRRVSADQVAAITRELLPGVDRVGVFAGMPVSEIASAVRNAGLTAAQLHDAMDPAMVRALAAEIGTEFKIIQTVAYAVDAGDRAAADAQFAASLQDAFDEPAIWAVLVDAAKSGASGGLGVTFDWTHVGGLVERAMHGREPRPRVILAGGLRAENVAAAIAAMHPWGVDVASGVELTAGKKDPARIRAFITAARVAVAGFAPKV
jgi:phosphoribosylanthranilate isomerase